MKKFLFLLGMVSVIISVSYVIAVVFGYNSTWDRNVADLFLFFIGGISLLVVSGMDGRLS